LCPLDEPAQVRAWRPPRYNVRAEGAGEGKDKCAGIEETGRTSVHKAKASGVVVNSLRGAYLHRRPKLQRRGEKKGDERDRRSRDEGELDPR